MERPLLHHIRTLYLKDRRGNREFQKKNKTSQNKKEWTKSTREKTERTERKLKWDITEKHYNGQGNLMTNLSTNTALVVNNVNINSRREFQKKTNKKCSWLHKNCQLKHILTFNFIKRVVMSIYKYIMQCIIMFPFYIILLFCVLVFSKKGQRWDVIKWDTIRVKWVGETHYYAQERWYS